MEDCARRSRVRTKVHSTESSAMKRKSANSAVGKLCAIFWTSLACFLVSLATCVVVGSSDVADSCDWSGSGFDLEDSDKTVRPVLLRCTAGRIQWAYPRGALLVELDPFAAPRNLFRRSADDPSRDNELPEDGDDVVVVGSGGNNLFCLKLDVPPSVPLVIHTLKPDGSLDRRIYSSSSSSSSSSAAAVGRTGDEKLRPLCFRSSSSAAAASSPSTSSRLLVETGHKREPLHREEINVAYHVEPDDGRPGGFGERHECRPCSPSEMLEAFCTSEFVARGAIKSVENDEDGDWTSLRLAVTRLHRQTAADVFAAVSEYPSSALEGVVHFPHNCRARPPSSSAPSPSPSLTDVRDEFLVMGDVKLGLAVVTCAPTWGEWRDVVRRAAARKSLWCRVDLI